MKNFRCPKEKLEKTLETQNEAQKIRWQNEKETTMGSQFLMSILKDSGIADIAISIVDYFIGRKDSKNAQNGKGGIKDRKGGFTKKEGLQ